MEEGSCSNLKVFIPSSATNERWKVNLKGVFLCYQKAGRVTAPRIVPDVPFDSIPAKQMIAQGKGGKLIAACSNSAYRPVRANRRLDLVAMLTSHQAADAVSYSVSKWGVRALTQCSALELGQYNINVGQRCPFRWAES